MTIIADLHVHSRYSMATSPAMTTDAMACWGRRKGIDIIGTGDFTHPEWLHHLKDSLVSDGPGLFRPARRILPRDPLPGPIARLPVPRFMLTSEISCIYRKGNRTRKVHVLVILPDFSAVDAFRDRLLHQKANLNSDGRPILKCDCRVILETALESSPDMMFIPAHIWTPWFSALGSRSGFDSLEACFEDLTPEITAVETGLSSSPAMNRSCPPIDPFTLVSNSDAHSPEKLGRNATRFHVAPDYHAIRNALITGAPETVDTIDSYPQEGKYYFDGHRKCGVRRDPRSDPDLPCPVCGRPLTPGVWGRIREVAGDDFRPAIPNPAPFIIPLKSILAGITGVGPATKTVDRAYRDLLIHCGTELDILLKIAPEQIAEQGFPGVAEAIRRMRSGAVRIDEGYDGRFGHIRIAADT